MGDSHTQYTQQNKTSNATTTTSQKRNDFGQSVATSETNSVKSTMIREPLKPSHGTQAESAGIETQVGTKDKIHDQHETHNVTQVNLNNPPVQVEEERRWSQFKANDIQLAKTASIAYTAVTPKDRRSLNSGGQQNSSVSVKPAPVHYQYKYLSTTRIDDELKGEDYDVTYDQAYGDMAGSQFQADASTMARPIGYRSLVLLPKQETSKKDAETQVSPMEIEKTAGLIRGIILDPYNVLWPTNGEFSIMKAEKKIEDYMTRCWKMCHSWFFHIEFLQAVRGCYRNKYIFEVKWSMPTAEHPIPAATASVYFVFDVETYGGRDETVKVHYIVEGTRYPHVPGEIPFQQKWISGIICEKMRLQKCS